MSTSLQAIDNNFDRLARSAERVSRAGDNRAARRSQVSQETQQTSANAPRNEAAAAVDLAAERVEQLNVRRSTEAQVKFLRTADEMLGLVLDLKA